MIIDAHAHLWEQQKGVVNGENVYGVGGGKSFFNGEIVQMLPPYLHDGKNSVEAFVANMDYACVNAGVITQEIIDGNQNAYLLKAKEKYPDRIKICALYEENKNCETQGFDGVKICAARLADTSLTKHYKVFEKASNHGKFISIDLADGNTQTGELQEIIQQYPNLKIAIGHFGMVTKENWQAQIKLATNKNVFIESGGITWLFNDEFYPYKGAIKAIKEAVSICSSKKIMWGSDYPRTMTAITYLMSLDFVLKSKDLTAEEKALFLGENAKDFYGFCNMENIAKTKNMVE